VAAKRKRWINLPKLQGLACMHLKTDRLEDFRKAEIEMFGNPFFPRGEDISVLQFNIFPTLCFLGVCKAASLFRNFLT